MRLSCFIAYDSSTENTWVSLVPAEATAGSITPLVRGIKGACHCSRLKKALTMPTEIARFLLWWETPRRA